MVKISIIIPVYNVEPFLSMCIESVQNQTLRETEIIIVDDGSLDESGTIINNYALLDDRIIAIHKENGGSSSARNTGLDIAKGEYIIFVDADDWIESLMLADMYAMAQKKSADIVICNYHKIYPSYVQESFLNITDEDINLEEVSLSDYLNRYYAYNKHGMSACNKLYKKAPIDKSNLRFVNEQMMGCEDGLFYLCYLLHTQKVSTTSKAYYNYRQRKGSQMHSPRPQIIKQHTAMIKAFVDYARKNCREEELKDIISSLLLMNIISGIKDNIIGGEPHTHIISQLEEASGMPYFSMLMQRAALGPAGKTVGFGFIKRNLMRVYAMLNLLRLYSLQIAITRIWWWAVKRGNIHGGPT